MHGEGVYTWPDGRKYTGTYVRDEKHGYGVFEWPDNRVYKGGWENGKQHGLAKYIKEGKERSGVWDAGKLVRWES